MVVTAPLAVEFIFPDASSWTARLSGLPNERLATDLAHGLASIVHPHGTIASRNTAIGYAVSLRQFVIALTDDGFVGGAADLTIGRVLAFWLANSHDHERHTRMILRGIDASVVDLKRDVRTHLDGRNVNARRKSQPYRHYSRAEWDRLTSCCVGIVEAAWARHQAVLAMATAGRSPKSVAISTKSLSWLMIRRGPMTAVEVSAHVGWRRWAGGAGLTQNRAWVREVRDALFPTVDVQLAYRLLFGIRTGIVPDGVGDLGLADIDWAGDATVLLTYVKGRTGGEGLTIPTTAVRLLTQWLQHSGPLRQVVGEAHRESLWLAISSSYYAGRVTTVDYNSGTLGQFSSQYGLLDDSGAPLRVHRGRVRATYVGLLATRGWTGRTTIDPNHSASVEGDHYLSASTPEQMDALEAIIEDGQADLVRRTLPPTVLTDEATARVVTDLPAAIAELVPDAPTITELVSGERDVFVAACADQLTGLWGRAGHPCPARPWVCLMCPLAIFLPRHAPNLLRLKAFFARQFRQMPADQFIRVFGPYADRMDAEILPRFAPAVLTAAAATLADTDTEIPLRPEELTR